MVGGYQIVDFKSTPMTLGTPKTISGIYEAIDNSNGKPLMFVGLDKVDGIVVTCGLYVCMVRQGTDYVGTIATQYTENEPNSATGITIKVESDDKVTIATVAVAGA